MRDTDDPGPDTPDPADPDLDDAAGRAPTLAPGHLVSGRFRIESLLGSGGMGAVHAATHLALDRRVALKVLHPALTRDPSLVARFRREARTMAGLRHPNIVEVIDAGEDAGMIFLVMEFLQGTAFSDWVEAHLPCDPAELLPLLLPVGRALSFVHAKGIVHRDVKPDNIFLVTGDNGALVPKLLDFGIARPMSREGSLTATGMILGTPAYMAPEQAWGLKEITPAADQWAFGAMLYEALSGQLPHQCDSPHALIVRRVSEEPQPLETLRPALDPALTRVVMRALSKDADARYESMDALVAALSASLDARPVSTAPPAPTPAPSPVPVFAPPPRPVPTSVWPRVVGALVLAGVVVASGAAIVHRGDRPTPSPSRPLTAPLRPTTPPRPGVAPAAVTLRFDFTPPDARIILDGADLGAGHASIELPPGGLHALRVEAEGYAPFVETLRAEGDRHVSGALVRTGNDAGRPEVGAVSPRRVTAPPPRDGAFRVPAGRRPIDTQWPP